MENKGFLKRNLALFIDSHGRFKDKKSFNPSKDKFEHKDKVYFTENLESCTYISFKGLLFRNYYFIYLENYSFPLKLDIELVSKKKIFPDSSTLNAILRSDVLQKLNRGNPFKTLFENPKNIVIALIIIAVAVYFITGGSLT